MSRTPPILWPPRKRRWLLNLYPPFLFQRIKIMDVDPGYRWMKVRMKKSLLTKNLNGSAFGGSIYSAADPWFPILYWQTLARQGYALECWLKAATADFKKPARSHLYLHFELPESDVEHAMDHLDRFGRSVRKNTVQVIDTEGDVCCEVECVSYMRLLKAGHKEVATF
ncbi:MAG: YiiD C-terminal domain-containing protein [Planctomycetes bacterium]|nr:YiiD C-terminal domain-containing protein [Planctomycetota bacterium]